MRYLCVLVVLNLAFFVSELFELVALQWACVCSAWFMAVLFAFCGVFDGNWSARRLTAFFHLPQLVLLMLFIIQLMTVAWLYTCTVLLIGFVVFFHRLNYPQNS